MRAHEFMTTSVVTVTPETPISEATRLLLDRAFSAVPVVDAGEHLIGIVSQADLLRGRLGADPRAHMMPVAVDETAPPNTVGAVMTRRVLALPATADQSEYAALMLEHKIKSVPVVANGKLVGMVSASDLLRTQVRGDDEIATEAAARLRDYGGGQTGWEVAAHDGVVTISGPATDQERRIAVLLVETVPGVARVHTRAGGAAAAADPDTAPDVAAPDVAAPDGAAADVAAADGAAPEAAAATGQPQPIPVWGPPTDHRGLRVLGLDECLVRLRQAPIGRLGFLRDGGPVVLPVNHGVDHLGVVFRATWGAKLMVAELRGPVAFEVDGIDEDRETGWSVLVTGTASVVYDNDEASTLERLGVRSWAGIGEDALWVRIVAEDVSGREILLGTTEPRAR